MKKSFYSLSGMLLTSVILLAQCTAHKKVANNGADNTATQKTGSVQVPESANASITINPAPAAEALQGKWEFDYFTNVATNKKILFPMQFPYLVFDVKQKKFSGMAGCNNVSGSYTINGDQLTFKQPMVITRMSCNAMGEKTFIEHLYVIDKFSIADNKLNLISGLKPVMIFKRAE